MYRINKHIPEKPAKHKVGILLKQQKKLFHTKDLALLWNIQNKQTLHTTIARYVNNGTLIPIYRGFYSTIPLDKINPIELGTAALHTYSYLSTETVLAQQGIIFQSITAVTFCSSQSSKFEIANHQFRSRQLKDIYLYNTLGIADHGHYRVANTERAVADLLYFDPKYHFDASDQLDWQKIKEIQKEVYKK